MNPGTKNIISLSSAQQSRHRGQEFESFAVKRLKANKLVRVEAVLPQLDRRQRAKVRALVEVLEDGRVVLGYGTQAEGLFWNLATGRLVLVEVSGAVGTSDGRHGLFRGDSARKVVGSLGGAATVCSAAGLRPDGLIVTNGLPNMGSTAGCYLNTLAINPGFYRFTTEWMSGWKGTRPQWTTLTRAKLRSHLLEGGWSPRNQQYSGLRAA